MAGHGRFYGLNPHPLRLSRTDPFFAGMARSCKF